MYSVAQINSTLHTYHTYISTWKKNHTKTYTLQTTILGAYKASVSRSLQFPTDLVAHTFSLHRYADAFSLQQLLLTVLQHEARLPKAQKKSTKMCDLSFLVVGLENMYINHIICIGTHTLHYTIYICISNLHTYYRFSNKLATSGKLTHVSLPNGRALYGQFERT